MEMNGLAALSCWPIEIDLGGGYTIPSKPALDWLIPMIDQDWLGIVPGMLSTDDDSIDDLLSSGAITTTDCINAAHDAVSSASGMPWWSACKLATAVVESEIAAELILNGVDAKVVSIGALVQATYRILVREPADKKQRSKVDSDLKRPPTGLTEKRYDPNVAASLFEQMARSRGVS